MSKSQILLRRMKRKPVQYARHTVQILFALFLMYVGWQFYRFYLHFASMGTEPYVPRPAAVEGFLPISALVSLKALVTTGHFDTVHPAGLVLLIVIVGSGLFLKKVFCSWMCPVGTLNEGLGIISRKLFKKTFEPPRWLEWLLYPIKYVLLFFFASSILFGMSGPAALGFLDSPYNKVSDIKMMQFFLDLGGTGLKVLLVLFFLSLFVRNFWCRYLCPYGALIGLGSLFRITGVKREENSCIGCNACTRVCPQNIKVSQKEFVGTVECNACLQCVEACPVKDTLQMTVARKPVSKWAVPAAFFGIFFFAVITAKALGYWQTSVPYEEFKILIQYMDRIGH